MLNYLVRFQAQTTCYLLDDVEPSLNYVVELSREESVEDITPSCAVVCKHYTKTKTSFVIEYASNDFNLVIL